MKAIIKAGQEKIGIEKKACLEVMEACLEKMKDYREQMRAGIKTGLGEMKATELEANQEKIDAMAKHYEGVPHAEAMHMLTTPKDWASDVLHEVPKEVTYKKTTEALVDCFGDQLLVTAYHSQLKTRIQSVGKSLQELATAVEEFTHHALPALRDNHGCKAQ